MKKLKPGEAAFDRWIWLPKDQVPVESLKLRLTFSSTNYQGNLGVFTAWEEDDTYLRLPRNYPIDIEQYGLRLVDRRPKSYEKCLIRHKIKPRPDQLEPLQTLSEVGDGTLNLGCGKGKTVVALYHAARVGVPTIILCDNASILKNWEREILEKLDVRAEDISWFKGDCETSKDALFCLATVQSLAKRAETLSEDWLRRWGLAIYDEGHHMSATFYGKASSLFYGQRLSLTATPYRNDGLEQIYFYHLGEVFHSDIEQELKPKCVFLHTPGIGANLPADCVGVDAKIKTWLAGNKAFNDVIAKETRAALRKKRRVMLLTHRLEQIDELEARLPGSSIIRGDISVAIREESIRHGNPIIASMRIGREGLDQELLDTLFICLLFRNGNDFQQTLGRILRVHPDKNPPIVVFFIPDIPLCQRQAKDLARMARFNNYVVETADA